MNIRKYMKAAGAGLCLAAVTGLTSCADYLDKTPDDGTSVSLEDVFNNEVYAERYLLKAYDYLPCENNYNDNDYWALSAWSGASDEMNVTWTYPMCKEMNRGSWNPKMLEGSSSQGQSYAMWWRYFEGIRQCNVFLANIDKSTVVDDATKELWKGEAYFMRAMLNFFLVRSHGPIPILDHVVNVDDDLTHFPRNTFDECVNFIVGDCQRAMDRLPIMYVTSSGQTADQKYGRATKMAALALKERMLLYAASPLFNGNPDYADYKNEDGTLLFGPEDQSKWQKAAEAARECINAIEANPTLYGLYYSSDPTDGYKNYMELFLPSNKWNKEYIFARNWGTGYSNNIHQEMCMAPNGMGGWSGLCPTQELVDEYEMADGSTPITHDAHGNVVINRESGYSETGFTAEEGDHWPAGTFNMYVNREPRFYATINFCGQQWRGRKLEFWQGGKDGINVSKVDYTSTGYLLRKTADENVDPVKGTGGTVESAIFFRVGGVYLDYAEALNEAQGPVADVYKYVNAIRSRAGLPNLKEGLSKDQMRERIRHERRIELAFEAGNRYFDCHRWKIAMQTDNGYMHGMNITGDYNKFFTRSNVGEPRVFTLKHYLFPIPQNEIDNNIGLVQSPYWVNPNSANAN